MTRWLKIGAVISVLWLLGLPIFFIVRSGSLKTVGHALIAGNSDTAALWTMMLGPVVFLWSIGVITLDAVPWIRQRLSEKTPAIQARGGGSRSDHGNATHG
jgi:hypothetical protein